METVHIQHALAQCTDIPSKLFYFIFGCNQQTHAGGSVKLTSLIISIIVSLQITKVQTVVLYFSSKVLSLYHKYGLIDEFKAHGTNLKENVSLYFLGWLPAVFE